MEYAVGCPSNATAWSSICLFAPYLVCQSGHSLWSTVCVVVVLLSVMFIWWTVYVLCRVVHVWEDLAVQIICDYHHKQLTHAVLFIWQPIWPQCIQHACTSCTLYTMNGSIVCMCFDRADLEEQLRLKCQIANNHHAVCPDFMNRGIYVQSQKAGESIVYNVQKVHACCIHCGQIGCQIKGTAWVNCLWW